MNTYWVNFAKNGDPNGSGLPQWPSYNSRKDEIIEFQRDGSTVNTPYPTKARLDVIEKSLNKK